MASQVEIATKLGINASTFKDLVARGVVETRGQGQYNYEEVSKQYLDHLREVAAGRFSGNLELGAERARLAKEQADAKEMENAIERGELVAMLADRTLTKSRSADVNFLGARARFPTGPYLLASVLKCPVYLVFGLHRPPNRYDLYCEPFSEQIRLPRRSRDDALRDQAQRFAERLEHYCRLAPDNWFNFYDFWKVEGMTR